MPRNFAPARRRFGQHFLHDRAAIRRIVDAFSPHPGQHIVEIGPGRGALTRELLSRVPELHAVELDRDLAAWLRTEFDSDSYRLTVHEADALAFDFSNVAVDPGPLRIIGNLPYNISTPLLLRFLEFNAIIEDMYFMLQREVAERLAAVPATKQYGRLTVMVRSLCTVEKVLTLGAGAFTPPPKVESTVVKLVPFARDPYGIADRAKFADVVRRGFGQRRKTIRNSLQPLLDARAIESAGIDSGLRADQLSIEQFAALSAIRSRP
ncbi:MAG: 16S rRNA (adenine(1518)-N(6)/adenine(1519)-N(6))-dimethyltransferase RsmA [Gammaproteobacteria bacterium]|nr:16S rRNA (adenine(1518)-N(6)/adenine(1519)-N(6))-dimethyltransferase RsmA [Gammaproteobacteria bacterium]MDH3464437.1 16S rRNA (adenine(1518)-N(6)/adenine(1519)-N(6))-dimethyltransferase RsmA [Gammaproteobacteria bacterium]